MNLDRHSHSARIGVLIAVALLPGCLQAAEPSDDWAPSAVPTIEAPPLEPVPSWQADNMAAIEGPSFDPESIRHAVSSSTQSRLWHHDGFWWSVLVADGQLRVHRMGTASAAEGALAWVDTGTAVDERPNAAADVLSVDDVAYVVTAGTGAGHSHEARLMRLRYDPASNRYERDANFPVPLRAHGMHSPTIARDSTSTLWVSYIFEDQLYVMHSMGQDERWSAPHPLSSPGVPGAESERRHAATVAYGGRVGVLWAARSGGVIELHLHRDGTGLEEWSREELVIEDVREASGALVVGGARGTSDGRLFVPVSVPPDALLETGSGVLRTVLVVREPDGSVASHLVARRVERYDDPVILIDEDAGFVHVLAAARQVGAIVLKSSALDEIQFAPGDGTELLPALRTARGPRSTKQPVNSATGLVLLAAEERGEYVSAVLHETGGAGSSAAVEDEPADANLVSDTFEPWGLETPAPGWRVHSRDDTGAMLVTAHDQYDGQRASIVPGPPDATAVRACRRFPPSASGVLSVEVSFMVAIPPPSDFTITALRGNGEALVVGVDRDHAFEHSSGAEDIAVGGVFRPTVWYRSTVEVDLDNHTFAWQVATQDEGAVLVNRSVIPWRSPDAAPLHELCLRSPRGMPGHALHVDDVRIHHRP